MFTISVGLNSSLLFGVFSSIEKAEEHLDKLGWRKQDYSPLRERIHGKAYERWSPWIKGRRRAYIMPLRKSNSLDQVE